MSQSSEPGESKERRWFELWKAERIKRRHYQHEVSVLRDELRQVRTAYATLASGKQKK